MSAAVMILAAIAVLEFIAIYLLWQTVRASWLIIVEYRKRERVVKSYQTGQTIPTEGDNRLSLSEVLRWPTKEKGASD